MNVVFAIGCSSYDDDNVANLKYAHRDAQRFAKVITETQAPNETEAFQLHDKQEDPRLRPTFGNILRLLSRGLERDHSIELDFLFFFFSGHGFRSRINDRDYLFVSDSSASALEDSGISYVTLEKYLRQWEAKHIVLFVDACRSAAEGGKGKATQNRSKIEVDSLCPPGMVTFCSCRPGQSSYEADTVRSGVFTHGVCRALSDEGKCSTIYELDTYLTEEIPRITREVGTSLQQPYSRVEPLTVQDLPIVSERNRNKWLNETPVRELRRTKVEAASVTLKQNIELCAIDFGTSYSSIAVPNEGQNVRLVPSPEGSWLVPSVVTFLSSEDYVVGWQALERASYKPHGTLLNIKRHLVSGQPWQIEGRTIAPEFAASLVIGSLKKNAEEFLSRPIRRALVSAPANFNSEQQRLLVRAFELAGLDVKRVISEPVAASLCLWDEDPQIMHSDESTNVLVVDLGGGTLDVSVVDMGKGVSDLIATAGDNHIGGIDFDEAISYHIIEEVMTSLRPLGRPLSAIEQARVRQEAERVKVALGSENTTSAIIRDLLVDEYGLQNIEVPVDRDSFRRATSELNERVATCIRTVFDRVRNGGRSFQVFSSGYDQSFPDNLKLDVVLLAGQGSKIFTIAEVIERTVGNRTPITNFQESAVVRGLSNQAGVLLGLRSEEPWLLLDATHRSVAIKVKQDSEADEEANKYTIHEDAAENTNYLTILDAGINIPTRKSEFVHFKAPHQRLRIQVVEMPSSASEAEIPLASVNVQTSQSEGELEVALDVEGDFKTNISVSYPGTLTELLRQRVDKLPRTYGQ